MRKEVFRSSTSEYQEYEIQTGHVRLQKKQKRWLINSKSILRSFNGRLKSVFLFSDSRTSLLLQVSTMTNHILPRKIIRSTYSFLMLLSNSRHLLPGSSTVMTATLVISMSDSKVLSTARRNIWFLLLADKAG